MKVIAERKTPVTMASADFDKAANIARRYALILFGIDQDGNCKSIKEYDRTNCNLHIVFESYEMISGMAGTEHIYEFRAKIWKES